MSLETVYAPRVSLPNAEDVEKDGSVQVPLPLEVGGGAVGLDAGAEAVEIGTGWVGEADGVPGDEADGDGDADGDEADDDGRDDGDDAERSGVAAVGPVAVMVRSIMAACFPLEAACLGT
jgi:hypothetical protein